MGTSSRKYPMNFKTMSVPDVPLGRNGKHKQIVSKILADLDQVLLAHAPILRIVQKKISQLGALLNQVQFRHALDFALEFLDRNAQQFAQDVTRIVEGQRLVEIAGKQIVFPMFNSHVLF